MMLHLWGLLSANRTATLIRMTFAPSLHETTPDRPPVPASLSNARLLSPLPSLRRLLGSDGPSMPSTPYERASVGRSVSKTDLQGSTPCARATSPDANDEPRKAGLVGLPLEMAPTGSTGSPLSGGTL